MHDAKHQPDIKDEGNIGMPLTEFTEEAWGKLVKGDEQIPVGFAAKAFDAFEGKRQELFQNIMVNMK